MAKLNDLIRCEDAIKEICKRTCTPGVLCPDAYCKEVKEWITDDMVVDAVEVVRCADCIRFRPDDEVWGWCTVSGKMRRKDYCSYGVRKDGDLVSNCYDCPMNPDSDAWMR